MVRVADEVAGLLVVLVALPLSAVVWLEVLEVLATLDDVIPFLDVEVVVPAPLEVEVPLALVRLLLLVLVILEVVAAALLDEVVTPGFVELEVEAVFKRGRSAPGACTERVAQY